MAPRVAARPGATPPHWLRHKRGALRVGALPHYFFEVALALPVRAARISAINSAIIFIIASWAPVPLLPWPAPAALALHCRWMCPHSPHRKHLFSVPPFTDVGLGCSLAAAYAAGGWGERVTCRMGWAALVGAWRARLSSLVAFAPGQPASCTTAHAAAPGRAPVAPCMPSAVHSSRRCSRASGSRPPASLHAAHATQSFGCPSTARCRMSIWASGPTFVAPA